MYSLNCLKFSRTFQCLNRIISRNACTKNSYSIERLSKRTLLSLSGKDTKNYLQSMMTNDIKNLDVLPSLYALLLNSKGSVIYDIILYKLEENEYVVEYDATGVEYLQTHMLMYRLRKDVKIQPLNSLTAWVIHNKMGEDANCDEHNEMVQQISKLNGVISCVKDPRIKDLGIRVITEKNIDLQTILPADIKHEMGDSYRLLRYKLGIGEGVLDHPPGECHPFDINVDLLNGVSFSKGCYIGQEMVARSHNVFVIRKRLMPVVLREMDSYPAFPPECTIVNEKAKTLGRFRNNLGKYGLALLKYEDCEKSNIIKFKDFDISLEVKRPHWWPANLKSENTQ
ncbi:putative transferase CAF17 homolog, mitochondrial [Parasteatoda tepidariorum]|uniref:putative transferase CAF17 homolog, mitochondrial n=1 Tax=Parasteatoda tepidariorum TaxID=114398 RepID=UPI00077F93D3|nr:putative transferase CAF17 homolog, mitochondrial [Parasteatoda tepidariorum]